VLFYHHIVRAVLSALLALYSLYLNSSLKRTLAYRDSMSARVSSRQNSIQSKEDGTDPIPLPPTPAAFPPIAMKPPDRPTGVNNLRLVGVICVGAFFFHAVYVLVLDVSTFNNKIEPRWLYVIIWFFYFATTELLPAICVLRIMRKMPPPEMGGRDNPENESFLPPQADNMMLASPTQLYLPLPQHPLYTNLWAIPQGESPMYEYGVTGYSSSADAESGTPGSYVEVVVEKRDTDDEEEYEDGGEGHRAHNMVVEQHQFDLRSSVGS